jgi:hypothetical protein
MTELAPPLDKLQTLGPVHFGEQWRSYADLGLGAEHIPELIRLAQDDNCYKLKENDLGYWTAIHARRVLGELRAEAAIEPLIAFLSVATERWDDLFCEDFPKLMGMIGRPAIPALTQALANQTANPHDRGCYAEALKEIAQRHLELRDECVGVLCRQLELFDVNDPETNGYLVGCLVDLKAIDTMPLIEQAYAVEGRVDETMQGWLEDVKYELGLGPKPPPRPLPRWDRYVPRPVFDSPFFSGTAAERARQRAQDRRRAKKAKRKARLQARKRSRQR